MAVLAEMEQDLLRECTMAGLHGARDRKGAAPQA